MDGTVTWLHISDLHARTIERKEQKRCWEALATDVRENYLHADSENIGKPDVVFMSGDVVQAGSKPNYTVAREALKIICDAAEVPDERVFIVPGNHDITRAKVPDDPEELTRLRLRATHADDLRQAVDQFWESTALQQLEKKFAAYLEFAHSYAPVIPAPLGSWVTSLEINGVRLRLCGLNTVWNGGTRELDAAGVPLVGVYQREGVSGPESVDGPEADCDSVVQIVLQHNSTDYLNVIDAVLHEAWLGQRDAIVLAGHLHNAQTAERRSVDGRHLSIIGGALYAGYRGAAYRCYSLGRLTTGRDLRKFDIDLRKQTDRGPFTNDAERYREAPEGRIKFTLSAEQRILGGAIAADLSTNGASSRRSGRTSHEEVSSNGRALRLIRDFVSLTFDEEGSYFARFEKAYHNESGEECSAVNARLIVNAFPDDPKKSRSYYRRHPLDLKEIKFQAESEGRSLKYQAVHDHDAHKELMLIFENRQDGQFPMMPRESRTVAYTFTIPTSMWGPYLERNVRLPTDIIECEVNFPIGYVRRVWGVHNPHILKGSKIEPSIVRSKQDGRVIYRWSCHSPALLSRYRINWAFAKQPRR